MSNDFYNHSGFPANNANGSSATMRSELDSITAGFDKLPALTGNGDKAVYVNASGTGLEARAVSGTPASGVSFTPTGTIAATDVQAAVVEVASEALQKSSNLSDVANAATARSNLAVGGLADNNTWTGTQTFRDNKFAITDDSDTSKVLNLQLSGITTATTRTLTVPDASGTVALKDVAQTFTATQTPSNDTASVSATGTYTFDGADQVREITLTNAITVTFGAPTGITENAMYIFKLKAGDTSARTFAWNSAYKFPAATPKLTSGTTTSGAKDNITFIGGPSNTLEYMGHQADLR